MARSPGRSSSNRLAVDLDEPFLGCSGLALQGTMAIYGGETARGFELLDEAMLPVLAGPDRAWASPATSTAR